MNKSKQLSAESPRPVHDIAAREGYNHWSAVYDQDDNPLITLEDPVFRSVVGNVAGLDVLDIGCGTGRHSVWLAAAGARITGIDQSVGMLSRARAKVISGNAKFIEHDLHNAFPFPAASFDGIACGLVLDHVFDLTWFFSQCLRVLRSNGWAVFSVVHPAMSLRGVQARFVDPGSGTEIRPESRVYSTADYLMAALSSGFRLEHISEHTVDDELAARHPRAAKYVNWPMLLMLRLLA